MHSLSKIERSAFRKGEYVGYAHGVWRISRGYRGGWSAMRESGHGGYVYKSARTLLELNAYFVAISGEG